jgi:2-dehydro-3-deoxyphosphogluconate aldolase / (4S)-4-hydroxy-2-oxoglutarate aldolase
LSSPSDVQPAPDLLPDGGSLLSLVPVVPVVVLDDLDHAVPVARALVAGGLPVIELTLRTPVALDAIAAIAAEVPEILVGAGTITSPELVSRAVKAGAQFLVSPGTTPGLLREMAWAGVPFLPGTATVSEAMAVLEAGYSEMKFFPAEASGGAAYLKSLASPLPAARFCPTGGITAASAPSYLSLPNVGCVGGSWLTPADALAAGDWDRVAALAREAAALGS